MKTRVGKIAQLPKAIRDELNQRLQNGKQGPELLKWLNNLPETKELLAEKFDAAPISKQNLSEWRRGGYEEWLRHQERELRIRRIMEDGASLKQVENKEDLFESSTRIAVAELMADIDSLHQYHGEERSKRLRMLTWELARLQNAYNRSRWAELAWTKWNDRFLDRNDYEEDDTASNVQSSTPADSDENEPSAADEQDAVKPSPTTSTGDEEEEEEEPDKRVSITRVIYHRKGCGCVCRTCHPDDAEYPYAQAFEDDAEAKKRGVLFFWRGYTATNTQPTECQCHCDQCEPAPIISPLRPISPTSGSKNQTEIVPLDPVADFSRRMALLKARNH